MASFLSLLAPLLRWGKRLGCHRPHLRATAYCPPLQKGEGSGERSPLGGTLMPRRSNVAMLPAEVRTNVERKMTDRAFSGYQQLARELEAQGYEISDDSLQRHGA